MYTFSNRLKIFSIVLIVIGALGWGYSYVSSDVSLDEVKELLAKEEAHHGGGHGDAEGHGESHDNGHAKEEMHEMKKEEHHIDSANHSEEISHDEGHDQENAHAEETMRKEENHSAQAGEFTIMKKENDHEDDMAHNPDAHAEHVQHQIHNRPYSALYVAAFFFFMIALGALAFYAVQRAAQAGWSPVLFRVMEAITYYVLPGGILVLLIAIWAGDHLFVWMDPEVVAHDKLIQGKSGWLNKTGFIIRGLIFLGGWSTYRFFARKFSVAQDSADNNSNFKKNFRISAAFLVFYIYTESMMSWDWIMSVDPHWFSTLFGWYVFASMFVSGITAIALVTIYLKSRGYLEFVNDSHMHDLAKFMFAISIFWTYLWFSQFMLIWYADIPEEVTYFATRIADYKLPFFGMLVMNFIFPFLVLMNSDYKRIPWFIVMAGLVILVGHYMDVYNMIMPATVGDRWAIGLPEISAVLFFMGLFIFLVFHALSKQSLLAKGNPFIKESEQFHY